jgi:hypothetical protein
MQRMYIEKSSVLRGRIRRALASGAAVTTAMATALAMVSLVAPAQAQTAPTLALVTPGSAVRGPTASCTLNVAGTYYCVAVGTGVLGFTFTSATPNTNHTWTATNATPNGGTAVDTNGSLTLNVIPTNTAAGQTTTMTVDSVTVTVRFSQTSPAMAFVTNPITTTPRTAVNIVGVVSDQNGIAVSGASVTGNVTAGPNLGRVTIPPATSSATGQFTLTYTDVGSATGNTTDTVSVTAQTPNAGSISQNVTVNWGAASGGGGGSNTGATGSLLIDGQAASTFTKTLNLATSGTLTLGTNAVAVTAPTPTATGQVTFTATGGGLLVAPNANQSAGAKSLVATATNGQAVAWVFATAPGTSTVSAQSGTAIIGTAPLSFTPQTSDARNIALTASAQNIQPGGSVTVTAVVTDGYGNKVPAGVPLAMQITSPAGTTTGGAKQVTQNTDANGQTIFTINTTANNTGQVVVTVTGTGAQFGAAAGSPVASFKAPVASITGSIQLAGSGGGGGGSGGGGQASGRQMAVRDTVAPNKRFKLSIAGFPNNTLVTVRFKISGGKVVKRLNIRTNAAGAGNGYTQLSQVGSYEVFPNYAKNAPQVKKTLTVKR